MLGKSKIIITLLLLITLAGCFSGGPSSSVTETPIPECAELPESETTTQTSMQTPTPTPTETNRSQNTTTESTAESPTETQGAQFYLAVDEVDTDNERRDLCNADADDRLQFANLSEGKQQEFLQALDEGRTRTGAWSTGSWYVKYEEAWYEVNLIIDQ